MKRFPRLLFVTPHAFNHIMGGGITFTNLFRGWPKDCLACVHSDSVPPSSDVCDRYYHLGKDELDIARPLQLARHVLHYTINLAGDEPAGTALESETKHDGAETVRPLRSLQRMVLGGTPPEKARLSPSLEAWIERFHPDILFTLLGSNGMMDLVERIRRRFDLPLVPHIMDDWPSAAYRDGLLGPWQRWRMQHWLKHFFTVAEMSFGIGTAMCEAFGDRYGRPFVPFQNTIDVARWAASAKTDLSVRRPARLLYVGSIFGNAQLQSLIDCAVAVRDLNRAGLPATLSIASPEFLVAPYRDRLAIDPSILIEPPITDDGVFFTRLAEADALLLPVNFDDGSIRMIRYSMPTKLPAYLVSGTPVLVYGPRQIAQVRYALDHGWGHVVSQRDPAMLTAGIRAVLEDANLRTRLSQTAQSVVRTEHDAVHVRRRFQALLCKAFNIAGNAMKENAA